MPQGQASQRWPSSASVRQRGTDEAGNQGDVKKEVILRRRAEETEKTKSNKKRGNANFASHVAPFASTKKGAS
jgi:hypothetical protein